LAQFLKNAGNNAMTSTILAAASGGSASNGAIELACRVAKRFEAHLECFHVLPDPRQFIMMAGIDMPVTAELVDRIVQDGKEIAAKTRAEFQKAALRHGLSLNGTGRNAPSANWREETGYGPTVVAERARFFDLVVLGRSERVVEQAHTDAVEQTLIRSGRPVLLAPMKVPATLGDVVVIGWNGSVAAVHAVSGSLILLRAARSVVVVSVGNCDEDASGKNLVAYLSWQGVAAQQVNVLPVASVNPGEQLLAAARDQSADLLVMGGYGHAPWREMLFGGATRQVVGTSLLPLLVAH
jgi:nucleotide-binding universal stress UspA family protein